MARKVKAEKAAVNDCDDCHEKGKNGRNGTVAHILQFDDFESLSKHLDEVFPDNKYCPEFFKSIWITAHAIFLDAARDRYEPLWVIYLEAHGVTFPNREEIIRKHRGPFYREKALPVVQPLLAFKPEREREPGDDDNE